MLFEELSYLTTLPEWAIALAAIWILAWKGLALWKSARKNSPIWFVVLLVINTLGVLEILYIFLFSKINLSKKTQKKKTIDNKISITKSKKKKK